MSGGDLHDLPAIATAAPLRERSERRGSGLAVQITAVQGTSSTRPVSMPLFFLSSSAGVLR